MVHAINYVTHVMGMKSIAEYVESQAILESLKAISVDYAQGFGIARPKPFYRPTVKQAKAAGL
jgi:EAL domain-containing protein (putative c-di-GMP-specific phosphodiesterase class I)